MKPERHGMTNPKYSLKRTIGFEQQGLQALEKALEGDLGDTLSKLVVDIEALEGRVIVTGIGKSGHVGKKIAATLASTGTPSMFLHPSEANHGDLGMITNKDAVLALSWSGETHELGGIIDYCQRFGVPLFAITSNALSALGRHACQTVVCPQTEEACPHGLAPTTSSTMQLVVGDMLAVALLEQRGFTQNNFSQLHPGGKLGASLRKLNHIMHPVTALPLCSKTTKMNDALIVMSEKGFGCIGVLDETQKLIGMITDGDLRRHMGDQLIHRPASDIMSIKPKVASAHMLVSEALHIMQTAKIQALFVTEQDKPVGLVHMHDVLRVGAI